MKLLASSQIDAYSALDALLGATHCVTLSVGTIQIKPLTLGALPTFMQWYSRWAHEVGESPADTATPRADEASAEAEVRVLELLTGKPFEWLSALSGEDLDLMVRAAFEANPTLFARSNDAKGRGVSSVRMTHVPNSLSPAIAQLVEAGHTLDAIQGYTLQQVEILCRAHAQLAAERQINRMCAMRAAQSEGKAFIRIVRDLEKTVQGLRQ